MSLSGVTTHKKHPCCVNLFWMYDPGGEDRQRFTEVLLFCLTEKQAKLVVFVFWCPLFASVVFSDVFVSRAIQEGSSDYFCGSIFHSQNHSGSIVTVMTAHQRSQLSLREIFIQCTSVLMVHSGSMRKENEKAPVCRRQCLSIV